MSILSDKRKRHIVPRWRSSLTAAASRDLSPLRPAPPAPAAAAAPPPILEQLLGEFLCEQSIGTAAEALTTAIAAGHPQAARPAAEFLHKHADEAPQSLVVLAQSTLGGGKRPFSMSVSPDNALAVARLRGLVRTYPRSATLWADLARSHASLGETEKAKRSMQVALGLAPNHRWVLRAANRLLLHAGDHREAHDLLARHPRTRMDPWLMTAEIASAQVLQVPPKFISRGRDLITHPAFAPVHLSELATAVATTELKNGNRKGARRLMRFALRDPTENAVAQVEWAESKSGDDLPIERTVNRMPDAFEAQFWVKRQEGQVIDALQAALRWMEDEPFADGPVTSVAHSAALLDDYETIFMATKLGLARDPENLIHQNNEVYALLSSGEALANEAYLFSVIEFLASRTRTPGADIVQASANAGLLMYRVGKAEEGRDFYQLAIRMATKTAGHITTAFAAAYHLREAVLAGVPWAGEALASAQHYAKQAADGAVDFFMRKIGDLVQRPHMASEIFGPTAAKRYLPGTSRKITDELKMRVTDEGPILIVPAHLMRR